MQLIPFLRRRWIFPFLPPLVIGIVLRLYLLPHQILLDDEWHALNYVNGKTFIYLLTHQGVGANCIPQNLYTDLVLHTVGWSEMVLRFPSVLCGILALLVLPWMVTRLFGSGVALGFAYFLAISPCVIFYSRICRPYSMVMFFGSVALFSLLLWQRERRRGYLWLYSVFGFLAIYYHLYAAIFILTPLLCLFSFSITDAWHRKRLGRPALPSPVEKTEPFCETGGRNARSDSSPLPFRDLWMAGILMGGLGVLLVLPANLNNPWWLLAMGKDRVTISTFQNFLSLLAGTPVVVLQIPFLLLAVLGVYRLWVTDRRTGILLTVTPSVFFANVMLSTQENIHFAIQIARYGILCFPIVFLVAGIGLAEMGKLALKNYAAPGCNRLTAFAVALLAACYCFLGPLPSLYQTPNNFIHHSAFQYSYNPMDWRFSKERESGFGFVISQSEVPCAYWKTRDLNHAPGIIEYPMLMGDHYNLFYYYQHFHQKPVAVGYVRDFPFKPATSQEGYVMANVPIDYVLSRIPAPFGLNFQNLLSLTDPVRLRQKHAGWLVVVHKDPLHEMFPKKNTELPFQPSMILIPILASEFGLPVYEDHQVIVFLIH